MVRGFFVSMGRGGVSLRFTAMGPLWLACSDLYAAGGVLFLYFFCTWIANALWG